MCEELPTPEELEIVFQEMQEEFCYRHIRSILRKQREIARDIAKRRYGISLGMLPYNLRKGILNEAGDIVTDQVIEESQGRIY